MRQSSGAERRPLRGDERIDGGRLDRSCGPGGQEFIDHRHFHHGDDLRAVNWRAYMRLEKLFLKMFQIEPRVPVRMLLDTSASMAAVSPQKFEYAMKLAGMDSGEVRLPLWEASEGTKRIIEECMKQVGAPFAV